MLRILLTLLLACLVDIGIAGEYPDRPIHVIVPFSPGGATDTPARLIGPKLSQALGQPVVIENRPGAGGVIGMAAAAKAAPDGYTLVVATNGEFVMNPWIYPKLQYDPFTDLTPISIMVESPLVLLVTPSSRFNSLGDIIAAARDKPSSVTYATAGVGSTSHVITEMLAQQAGMKLLHVPYKGGAPASAAIISGEVAFGLLNIGSAAGVIKGARAKPLAITSAMRHPGYPSLPTTSEAGVPNFAGTIWVGMAAPAGVPSAIVQRLSMEVRKALGAPDVRQRLEQMGVHVVGTTSEETAKRIEREAAQYKDAIKQANIRAE